MIKMQKFKKNKKLEGKLISSKELDMMLYEKGRQYVLTMYCNRYFNMTKNQLNKVMNYRKGGE
jgi:hypothetical protein